MTTADIKLSRNGHSPDSAPLAVRLTPVPSELPHTGLRIRAVRGAHAGAIGARYFAPAIGRAMLRRKSNTPRATRRTFEAMGATYMKFGQFIASAPGMVGEEVAAEFRSCLDTGPAVPFENVRRTVEAGLGRKIDDAYARFEEVPVAAASIAVVHRAWLHDGTPVAVKVLRPNIERIVATDIATMEAGARFLAARGVLEQGFNAVSLIVGLRAQIAEELNLENEARAMDVFRGLFEQFGLTLLVVPRVYTDLSSRRVLTMDWLDGAPIDDLPHARSLGIDLAEVVRELLRAWVLTGLRAGAFHADIHAGNLLLLRDGKLGMLDWGVISRMDGEDYRMFRALCEASIGREEAWEEMGDVMLRLNGPSLRNLGLTDDQIRRLIRAMFEPALTRPLSEVNMSELMMSGDDVIRKATGQEPPKHTLRNRLRMIRLGAKAYRRAAEEHVFEHPTMRMSFLSMKQLVYLERYARMYMPDETLLGDGEFVRYALSDAIEDPTRTASLRAPAR